MTSHQDLLKRLEKMKGKSTQQVVIAQKPDTEGLMKKHHAIIESLVARIAVLEKEVQKAPRPIMENNYSTLKSDFQKQLDITHQNLNQTIRNYFSLLSDNHKQYLSILKIFSDSKDPQVINTITRNVANSQELFNSEVARLTPFIKSTPQKKELAGKSMSTSQKDEIEQNLDMMTEFRQQQQRAIQRKENREQQKQPKEKTKKVRVENYVRITDGQYQGQIAEVREFNQNNGTVLAIVLSTGNQILLKPGHYEFDADPFRPGFAASAASSRRSSNASLWSIASSSQGSQGSRRGSVDFQPDFEQEVRARQNIQELDADGKVIFTIITEIIEQLRLESDILNINEIISNVQNAKVEIRSTPQKRTLIAAIIFVFLHGTSIQPIIVEEKCPSPNWITPVYLGCVLEKNGYIKPKKNSSVSKMIEAMLGQIGIALAPAPARVIAPVRRRLSNTPKSVKPLAHEIQERQDFNKAALKQNIARLDKRRGGPGKVHYAQLGQVSPKKRMRSQDSLEQLVGNVSRLNIQPPRQSSISTGLNQMSLNQMTITPPRRPSKPISIVSVVSPKKAKTDLSTKTVKELKTLAKGKVPKFSTMKKDDLVEALSKLAI